MNNLFYLPSQYMPPANTKAFKVLSLLSDGLEHVKAELMLILMDDPRSPLQALRGKLYSFWLIHNTGSPKAIYQLDKRHLSGDRDIDMQARTERERTFLEESREQAEREALRLPNALRAEAIARASGQFSLNFTNVKQHKAERLQEIEL